MSSIHVFCSFPYHQVDTVTCLVLIKQKARGFQTRAYTNKFVYLLPLDINRLPTYLGERIEQSVPVPP